MHESVYFPHSTEEIHEPLIVGMVPGVLPVSVASNGLESGLGKADSRLGWVGLG